MGAPSCFAHDRRTPMCAACVFWHISPSRLVSGGPRLTNKGETQRQRFCAPQRTIELIVSASDISLSASAWLCADRDPAPNGGHRGRLAGYAREANPPR